MKKLTELEIKKISVQPGGLYFLYQNGYKKWIEDNNKYHTSLESHYIADQCWELSLEGCLVEFGIKP